MTQLASIASTPATRAAPYDLEGLRAQFPILGLRIGDAPLAYLDNGASSQMPQPVIDRLVHYQRAEHANIHRGVHYLSETATAAFEGARRKVQRFLNAAEECEIIFTRGTTDALNLVMHGFGRAYIGEGDEIIVSTLEHHSNIVPWQMLCQERGCHLRVIPCNDRGELLLEAYAELLGPRTRLVAITHVSNALGSISPLREVIDLAHARGVPVLVDGAQAVAHIPVDVQALDCDFYCFSGHKLYGPTGIGVLYGKAALLEKMQPYQGGGDMILSVSFEKTIYNVIPHKFEAGTPPIAAAIGLGAAIDFVTGVGIERAADWEATLLDYATEQLSQLPGVRLVGTAQHKASVLSFVLAGVHPHDVGTVLNEAGVAVRTGHHCAQPVMQRFGLPATVRASFALYNRLDEVDQLVGGLQRVARLFA